MQAELKALGNENAALKKKADAMKREHDRIIKEKAIATEREKATADELAALQKGVAERKSADAENGIGPASTQNNNVQIVSRINGRRKSNAKANTIAPSSSVVHVHNTSSNNPLSSPKINNQSEIEILRQQILQLQESVQLQGEEKKKKANHTVSTQTQATHTNITATPCTHFTHHSHKHTQTHTHIHTERAPRSTSHLQGSSVARDGSRRRRRL